MICKYLNDEILRVDVRRDDLAKLKELIADLTGCLVKLNCVIQAAKEVADEETP